MVCLIGETNEAPGKVDGVECTALIDLEAQMSTITTSFAKHLGLQVQHHNHILNIEVTGGGFVPYLGYVETCLQIPRIRKLDEDVLMLVLENSPYGDRVPIQIGTWHIDSNRPYLTR